MTKQPKMPNEIYANLWPDTDHPEFHAGTWTNSPSYGVGERVRYVRADLVPPAEPLDVEGVK